MKKVKLNSRMQLNKQTITNLNCDEMNNVKGGAEFLSIVTCKVTKCPDCNPLPSTPQQPATCGGATCLFLNGCK